MAKQALVVLDIPCAHKGHDKQKITIDDDSPQKRAKLAEHVANLLRDGFQVLLSDGRKVTSYDPATNEWVIASAKKAPPEKVPAKGKPATAVAPVTGG